MSSLIPFRFETHSIRVVVIDNQPFFSARDVALALDYADPSQAYNLHCKSLNLLSYSELLELNCRRCGKAHQSRAWRWVC